MMFNELKEHKGFVAFIDILGFKNMVFNDVDISTLFNNLFSILDKINSSKVNHLLFSDSLLLYTKKDSEKELNEIIDVCSFLLFEMLINNIPIRGCLSYGNFYLNKVNNGTIITGKPLIDAIEIEGKQNWIGIMVSQLLLQKYNSFYNVINHRLKSNISSIPDSIVKSSNIPVYENNIEKRIEGYTIFPVPKNEVATSDYDKTIDILEKHKLTAPNKKSQDKFQNTINFILAKVKKSLKNTNKENTY